MLTDFTVYGLALIGAPENKNYPKED